MTTITARAEDLAIAGVSRYSSVDWPGKLVATIFCQGCPWRCPYCHNHAIIDPTTPGQVPFDLVRDLLAHRRGLLDGVVFSGGEPLRQGALQPAAEEVIRAGYGVGLHTAGPYPRRLRQILAHGLIEWVGLDIKALATDYARVAGVVAAGRKAWDSLETVLASGVDYEVRVTAYPDGPDPLAIGRALAEAGVRTVALQQARGRGAPTGFRADGPGWSARLREVADAYDVMFDTFRWRPA